MAADHASRVQAAADDPISHGMDGCAIPPMAVVAQADLHAVLADLHHAQDANDADVRAVSRVLDLYAAVPYHGLGEMELIAAAVDLQACFDDRINDLRTREANAPQQPAHDDQPKAETMPEPTDTALDHARAQWHETNTRIGDASGGGNPPDPYLFAALLDGRAGWWDHLGQLSDRGNGPGDVRDVYAIACCYAAELDREMAARVRFRHRIPTLHPSTDAQRVGLNDNRCECCGRPWQFDPAGACPHCPALMHGITPRNANEAATYPPGQRWTHDRTVGQEDISTAQHERVRGEPLTETQWDALRELAWTPIYTPPAGTPERCRHDALRTALGEAERLAGRARSSRSTAGELVDIIATHRVMAIVDGHGQTPKLYTDLMEWAAVLVERATYQLREQVLNQDPNKITAPVKADLSDGGDSLLLRQRPIPDQLDYLAEKLAGHLNETIPSNAFVTIAAAVVNLGAIATELRNAADGGQ